MGLVDRLQHGWNAFMNKDPTITYRESENITYHRPDRMRFSRGNERSIVTAIYNRIAIDCASVKIQHVQLDDDGRFSCAIESGLNNCLNVEANIDQSGRAFLQDVYMSIMDEGCIAVVPTDTTIDPTLSGAYDIDSMRTGRITEWRPTQVKVKLYNERNGRKEEIYIHKRATAIIENPLFAVMNEPNSTMQRLIRKLNILDAIDEQSGAGKLDLIVQLPYVVRSPARKEQAETRRKDIEDQLSGSKYGIAYIDGTEHVTQLNRSIDNNLMHQIEYLISMAYSQLGITQEIMNGTADEKTMLNYQNRTIEPIVSAFVDEMIRKFLTKTARSQKKTIMFFKDPFRLVPVADLAEIADKLTRNEIASSNEVRSVIGWKPSKDPKADELRNKNLNETVNSNTMKGTDKQPEKEEEIQNG